jgi:outer membrane protein assembly factor BamB
MLMLGGCWIQPGFGPSRQGYTPFDGGTTRATVTELEVAWRRVIGAYSTRPIVVGSRIVATAGNHIEALDLRSGAVQWEHTHTDTVDPNIMPALGDPTWQYDGAIHVPFSVYSFGGAYRYDVDTGAFTGGISGGLHGPLPLGTPAIRSDTTVAAIGAFSPGGSLVELVYNGHRGLISFSSFPPGSPPVTDPMLDGRRAYIGSGNDLLQFGLDECSEVPAPFPAGYCFPTRTIHLNGTTRTPAATDQAQVAVTDSSGALSVFDPITSTVIWTAERGTALAPPVISPGRITVAGADGKVRSFRSSGCGAATCAPRWIGDAGAAITTQPAASGGVIYVGTAAGTIVAFDALGCGASTCAPIWTGDANAGDATPSAVRAGPIVAMGRVFVTLENGELVAFSR